MSLLDGMIGKKVVLQLMPGHGLLMAEVAGGRVIPSEMEVTDNKGQQQKVPLVVNCVVGEVVEKDGQLLLTYLDRFQRPMLLKLNEGAILAVTMAGDATTAPSRLIVPS